ncbi:hypothetical protein NRK67_11655 [Fusobacteria bacterium ZRK30]|nr:hypothetical protein NRK67_11655 [Fusobacteria bacterium ZRK30]
MIYLILFFIVAGGMVFFAKRLTYSGDSLGKSLGMESSWVGIVLLASITSLPELVTGITSTNLGNQTMAVANIFGSNTFNLFIIFILDAIILKRFVFIKNIDRKEGLKLSILTLFLSSIFILGSLFKEVELLGQSPFILFIFGGYIFFMKSQGGNEEEKKKIDYTKVIKPFKIFLIDSIGVVILGFILSQTADKLAVTPIMGIVLGQSIIGGFLLAVSTSLPELIVSTEAVKKGDFQMAMGNILGSNLFNLATLMVVEFISRGSLYNYLEGFNFSVVGAALLIQGIFSIGLYYKKEKFSFLLLGGYLLSLAISI